ncbi:unnamed protein product [Lathyrus sativus]|nr:unnamed protein product [Lathyrus sativus]
MSSKHDPSSPTLSRRPIVQKAAKGRRKKSLWKYFDFSYDHLSNDATILSNDSNIDFQEFLRRRFDIRDKQVHRHLQQDLIEHIWQCYGHENDNN